MKALGRINGNLDMNLRGHVVTVLSIVALVVALGAPTPAEGQGIDGDLRLGVYTDAGEAFVGGGILTRLGSSDWFFNPNAELVFVDPGDLATLNLDFHYDLASEGEADFWLGAGPALILRENRRGQDDTELGVNLFAGVGFLRTSAVRPFLQAKLILSDESEGVLAFGIRFF